MPKEKRNYLLLLHYDKEKSNPWVSKLAEKYLAFPPAEISYTWDKRDSTLDFQHIVFFDDASYSGNHLISLLQDYSRFVEVCNQFSHLQFHLILPFATARSLARFKPYNVMVHTNETIPAFNVADTCFKGQTATYFDHKIPCSGISTIECIEGGKLINGEESGISFVELIEPPYKKNHC